MLSGIIKWLESKTDSEQGGNSGLAPILTGDSIDLVAVREDGGVDLIILIRGHLDDSESTQNLLESKVKNYLQQRNSPAFKTEFRNPPADKVCVILETNHKLPGGIHALMKHLESLAQANQAGLIIRNCQFQKFVLRGLYFPMSPRGFGGIPSTADSHGYRYPPEG